MFSPFVCEPNLLTSFSDRDQPFHDLKELVLKAIASYNRYRSPEAAAELAKLKKDKFIIEFSGPFCLGCGVSDYFEDFIYELKDQNHQVKIKQFKRTGPQSYEVEYIVLRS